MGEEVKFYVIGLFFYTDIKDKTKNLGQQILEFDT